MFKIIKFQLIFVQKTAPASCFGNRGGSFVLFALFQALTQSHAGIFDRSLGGCQNYRAFGTVICRFFNTLYLQRTACNGVQREHNKKLNNGLPILHKVPPKRDYGRYFCIMAEKGGTSHGGLTEKLSPFFHSKKQEVNAYGR